MAPVVRIFLIAGVFVFLTAHAEAASFDCKKAKTEVEKTVCADPQLSAWDEKLAETYRAALAKLSPEGQRLLREGQREWLKDLSKSCAAGSAVRLCIETAYKDRLRELSSKMVQVGEYLFIRVDLARWEACTGGDGQPRSYEERVSYLRIEAPSTEATAQWNAQRKRSLGTKRHCDPNSESDTHDSAISDIEVVDGTIVMITSSTSECCETFRYSYGTGSTQIVDLSRGLDPLNADDFFASDSGWQTFLAQRSEEDLKRQAPKNPIMDGVVIEIASDPANWTLGAKDLSISFPPGSIGGYSFEVSIPWTELKPYLRPDAPFPK